MNKTAYGCFGHTEGDGEGRLHFSAGMSRSDGLCLSSCQSRFAIARSGYSSVFGLGVGPVVGVSANEQVRRPTARPNIASVKDELARWNWSVSQSPRNAVGTHPSAGKDNVPVAVRANSSGPKPAALTSGNMVPKLNRVHVVNLSCWRNRHNLAAPAVTTAFEGYYAA